jgi:hypothetical protein
MVSATRRKALQTSQSRRSDSLASETVAAPGDGGQWRPVFMRASQAAQWQRCVRARGARVGRSAEWLCACNGGRACVHCGIEFAVACYAHDVSALPLRSLRCLNVTSAISATWRFATAQTCFKANDCSYFTVPGCRRHAVSEPRHVGVNDGCGGRASAGIRGSSGRARLSARAAGPAPAPGRPPAPSRRCHPVPARA